MPSTSPKFMSGEYLRKSVVESNGISGTATGAGAGCGDGGAAGLLSGQPRAAREEQNADQQGEEQRRTTLVSSAASSQAGSSQRHREYNRCASCARRAVRTFGDEFARSVRRS